MHQKKNDSAGTSKTETGTVTNASNPPAEEDITDEQWKQILSVLFDRGDPLPEAERVERAKQRLRKAIAELNH